MFAPPTVELFTFDTYSPFHSMPLAISLPICTISGQHAGRL